MSFRTKMKSTTGILTIATVSMFALAACDQGGSNADAGSNAADATNPCAAANPCNPCAANPCAANPCAANPCAANPCAANPCAANPCAANPCAANPCAANPCNPCAANPCAANPCAANPCNPCAANPCAANPCAANPCAANPCAANPCAANPCAAAAAVSTNTDAGREASYLANVAAMAAGYAKSGNPNAGVYAGWTRFNTDPARSQTHGGRYVSTYANSIGAEEYGKFEDAGVMPVGTVLAKDSLLWSNTGEARPGPLFLMEKMEAGFNPEFGDWKYTLIMPNGSIWGETNGVNNGRIGYCQDCHVAVADYDHRFLVPAEKRR